MKLYLSSYKFGDDPQRLASLIGQNKKIAVISNALDFSRDIQRRNRGTEEEITELERLGLNPEEIDLRNYFGKSDELEAKMSEFGSIWVRGGNTFILRKAFKNSGFDNWLREQKNNKEFVYAGYSAGVCVLSPSLRGSDLTDDPNAEAEGYTNETIWDGLGIIDFAFAPHFESNHPESESIGREVEFYVKNGIKFESLHDGEVIVTET